MTVRPLRYIITMLLSGAILTFLVGIASVLFLRNLGDITGSLGHMLGLDAGTAQTLSEIFDQLRSASLHLPLEIVGVVCCLFCGLVTVSPKTKKAGRIVTVCILGIIFFLLLTAVTVWFTEVNGIRFDRVMVRLVSLLKAGIL